MELKKKSKIRDGLPRLKYKDFDLGKFMAKLPEIKGWGLVIVLAILFTVITIIGVKIGQAYPSKHTGDNLVNMSILLLIVNLMSLVWKKCSSREPQGTGGM